MMLTDPVSLPLWTLNNLVSRPIRPSVPESLRAFNEGFTEGRISAVEDCEYTTGGGVGGFVGGVRGSEQQEEGLGMCAAAVCRLSRLRYWDMNITISDIVC